MATNPQDIVDAIDAAILALVTGKITSYTVGNQTFTYQTLPDLRATRADFARMARLAIGTSGVYRAEVDK